MRTGARKPTDDGRPFAALTETKYDCIPRLLSLVCIVTIFFVAPAGCASLTGPGREVRAANSLAENKKYSEAVLIYRKVLREHPDSSSAADARFALATTLACYENPQRDYAQAFQEFDEFVRLYPDDSRLREAQNWRHVLKALHDRNKSIEDLKKLDIRHEEKRKKR